MTNLQIGAVPSTIGIAVVLATSLALTPPHGRAVPRIHFEPVYRYVGLAQSAANTQLLTEIKDPTEADFLEIAQGLAMQQERLGEEFERILANHLDEFLD